MDTASTMEKSSNHTGPNIETKVSAIAFLRGVLGELKAIASTESADSEEAKTATLGDVISRLDERAFGMMLLLLALPCCLPFIYLLPQIVALPMLALAGQLALGRHAPWLPSKLKNRNFQISHFEGVLERSDKYLGVIERFAKPRLTFLTDQPGIRVIGALLIVPTASILIPLPSTNTIPGIGVAIASLGLIERDGVLILFGLMIGLCWVALLGFFGLEAASLIKVWLSSRL